MFLFLIFLLACGCAGMTGYLFPTGEWYKGLRKPSCTPPDRVFPVAWTTLYLLITVAGARVAAIGGPGATTASPSGRSRSPRSRSGHPRSLAPIGCAWAPGSSRSSGSRCWGL